MVLKTSDEEQIFTAAVRLFNEGEFYACDETLVDLFLEASGEEKLFYQGLIQIAGAFVHLERAHYEGFLALLNEGITNLEGYLPTHKGIDLKTFVEELEQFKGGIVSNLKAQACDARPLSFDRMPKINSLGAS